MNIAVYTAIFNGYDTLYPVPDPDPAADYICFSNQPLPDAPAPWQVRVVPQAHRDPRKAVRYYLLRPTWCLPEYAYTIMHGGNAVLVSPVAPLLSFLDDTDIAAYPHPHRDNVYAEGDAIATMGKDNYENFRGQLLWYEQQGFDGKPLSANGILVRRNSPRMVLFELFWWTEMLAGSHRDQLSFDYSRWVCGLPLTYLTPGDVFNNPYLQYHAHAVR